MKEGEESVFAPFTKGELLSCLNSQISIMLEYTNGAAQGRDQRHG